MIGKFASIGSSAFASAGVKVEDGNQVGAWMNAAGLNWQCREDEVVNKTTGKDITGYKMLSRSDNGDGLCMVSNRYKPVQPAAICELFAEFVDRLKTFKMVRAGWLSSGKIFAVAQDADQSIIERGGERLGRFIILATSYDKSLPTIVTQSSVSFWCTNQLAAITKKLARAGEGMLVRHSSAFNHEAAMKHLALNDQWERFGKLIEQLSAKRMADESARRFFDLTLFPGHVKERANFSKEAAEKKIEHLMQVLHNAPGQQIEARKGTVWGAVNAVTYVVDHEGRSRSDTGRFDRAVFGQGNTLKNRALALATEWNG